MLQSSQSAQYELEIEGVSDVRPFEVEYEGALNDPYKLTVKCHIEEKRKDGVQEVTESMRGKNASFRMFRDTPGKITEEFIRGMVIAARRVGRVNWVDEQGAAENKIEEHADIFIVEIVPGVEFLKFELDKPRAWHNQTYKKVLKEVLDEGLAKYNRTWRDEIQRDDIIDSIIQVPGESDLEFVMGLCTEGGINCFFDHSGDKEVLVLSDKNDAFLEGFTFQTIPLRVGRNMSGSLGEWISEFKTRTDSDLNEMKPKCFDQIESPGVPFFKFEINPSGFLGSLLGMIGGLVPGGLPGGLGGGGGGGGGLDTGVKQEWEKLRPNEVGDKEFQFKQNAEDEASRLQTNLLRNDAQTGVLGMIEGKTFDLETKPDDTRKYVVERVHFRGRTHGDIANPSGRPSDFANDVTVVPLTTKGGGEVKVKSPTTQPPQKMPGFSLAEIVGLEAHPVEVDEFMRVRFKFLWDEQNPTPQECWCMTMQPMAGRFGGTQYIPREGDRVLLAFIEGNRNLAVIVGGFFDEEFKPPIMGPKWIKLPESDLIVGFSHSSIERGKKPDQQGALDRVSQMSIDVTAHEEMFFFNAPWDWRQDIGNDCEINIEHDRKETVKNDWTLTVDGKSDETIKGDKTETYQKNLTTSIQKNETTTIMGRRIVSSQKTQLIQDAKKITIQAPKIKLAGDVSGGMGASPSALFEMDRKLYMDAPEWIRLHTDQTKVETYPNKLDMATPGTITAEAGERYNLQAGTTKLQMDSQAFDVQTAKAEQRDAAGGRTTLTNGSYVVDVPQGVTLRCGPTELRLSPEGVFINGQQVRIDGRTVEIQAERVDVTGDRND